MDLSKAALPVTLFVKTTTPKYRLEGGPAETSLELICKLVASGDFNLELTPGWLSGDKGVLLLLTEREAK